MKVLITGFNPFGGESKNPAFEAVKRLPDGFENIEIVKVEVPTEFYESVRVLRHHVEKERPDLVICVGQAGGRAAVSIERVAINIDDARIPDNAGNQPLDEAIVENGPAAYFSTLPIKAMANAIREGGIPATVSNSAGTYVCNHIMYGLMHMIDTSFPGTRGGFIHVPYLEDQVLDKPNMPAMSLASITKALEIAVKTACSVREDIQKSEGTVC